MIYIGTGITKNYFSKALNYLYSLNNMKNINIKMFCITVNFNIDFIHKTQLNNIKFIRQDVLESENLNYCLQHGDFIKSLSYVKDSDIIVFTDSDIIVQPTNNNINKLLNLDFNKHSIYVSYNRGDVDSQFNEFNYIQPNISVITYEEVFKYNLRAYKCFNTGVIITTKKTYKEINSKYFIAYLREKNLFNHFAKQQFILNNIINIDYNYGILDDTIHTHGHYHGGNIKEIETHNNIITYNKEPILFAHNLYIKPFNILYIMPESGTAHWRCKIIIDELNNKYKGHYNIKIIKDIDIEKNTHINLIKEADLIITHAIYSIAMMKDIKNNKKDYVNWIADIDDDYFNIPEYNPAYDNNETDSNNKLLAINAVLNNADIVTVSTEYLKNKIEINIHREERNKPYIIIPNYINNKLWSTYKKIENKDKIIIGWFGGSSHANDFDEIQSVLVNIMNKYDNIYLKLVGDIPLLKGFEKVADRFSFITWDGLYQYPRQIVDFDIGIIPLTNNDFNNCKSNIKWLEYGILGIPSIIINKEPYKMVKHNVDGLLYNTPEEFETMLELLINNKEERNRIGNNAKEEILKNWTIENNIDNLMKEYEIPIYNGEIE
jgi:glycosyltransferase involved in cell wall biosynthesis